MLPLLVGGQNAQNSRLSGTGQLILRVLANDTVTPAVVLIGGATITPQWYWSDGTSFSGLDGFGGAGKVVTTGMTVTLDTQGHPEEIAQLNVQNDPFGFDLSALAAFTGLTQLRGNGDTNAVFTGGLGDLPASLTVLNLGATGSAITGSLADLPPPLQYVYLQTTGSTITGALADLPPGVKELYLHSTASTITGSLSDLPTTMLVFLVHSTTSTITGGGTPVPALGLNDVSMLSTTMTEAQIDDVLIRLYTDRNIFTDAGPAINLAGTNPALSDIGNDLGSILANDPLAEGFNVWAITPNPVSTGNILPLDILANDTVTPAVVLIGGGTIVPDWYYSNGVSMSGLNGYTGGGDVVTAGMTLILDTKGAPEEIGQITLTNDPFGFDLSALAQFTGLTHILGSGDANAIYTGSLTDLPASMTYLQFSGSSSVFTGTVLDFPAGTTYVNLYNTSSVITGALSDLPTTVTAFTLTGTPSTVTGGGTAVPALGLALLELVSTTMTQPQVDSVCLRLYTDRAIFTDASPKLNIGGSNPNPSGVYQDDATPSTGLEYVYKIVVDPDAEGFNAWTVTY